MFHLRDMLAKTDADTLVHRFQRQEQESICWQGPERIPLDMIENRVERKMLIRNALFSGQTIQSLKTSILAIQLTTPLYLMRRKNDSYCIISGFARFNALKTIKKNELLAFTIDEEHVEGADLLFFWVTENRAHRCFNLFEKAFFVDLLVSRNLDFSTITKVFANHIGIPANQEVIAQHHRLLQLTREILDGFVSGKLTEFQTLMLASLPRNDRKRIFRYLVGSRLNNKEFTTFVRLVSELSQIEQKSNNEILDEPPLQHILAHERMNKREKGTMLLKELKNRRFPKLSRHEQKFFDIMKKARIPPGLSIQPPPFFEGDAVRIMFSARSTQEIEGRLKKLRQMLEDQSFKEILDLL